MKPLQSHDSFTKWVWFIVVAAVVLTSSWRVSKRITPGAGPLSARQLEAAIPADSELVTDVLDNGVRYYLLPNGTPDKRVELRLIVNIGSVMETDSQRGLAHAVEHMLFRGTKHFPSRAIDHYFESVGMRSGQDVNAWTGMDQTVYSITIPTDRAGALDTAITILADMAHAATFDPLEARTEAGIVFEEWRSGSGAGERFTEQRNQLLMAGSQYAFRAPIGDTAVLRRFDTGELRAFYNEWYRPELMAVAIVGDIAPRDARQLVRKHFGEIPGSTIRKVRPAIAVPIATQLRAAALTDAEATGTRIALWFPTRRAPFKQIKDYRDWMIGELWEEVLNDRLEDVTEEPGSPLIEADASRAFPVLSLEAEVVSASVADDRILPAVDRMMTEVKRLTEHGPTQSELDRLAELFIKDHWRGTAWDRSSAALADGYADQFLTGGVVITRQVQYSLAERMLRTITVDDVRQSARRALADSAALVLLTQPTGKTREVVASSNLVERVRQASQRPTTKLPEISDSVQLMSTLPTPGRIVSDTFLRDIETFDLKLSNGMRVLLKPSEFTNNDIEFRMVGPGGASIASEADYASAYLSDNVVAALGVGSLNGTRLDRLLETSSIDFTQHVSDGEVAFRGELAPRDLEKFFQLLHLKFTAPRSDSAAFRRFRDRLLSSALHRDANPDVVFDDTVAMILYQNKARTIRDNAAFYQSMRMNSALEFWKQRMANASGFTLVMTGSFTMMHVRPLLERYVASLPAGNPEQPRDNASPFPKGVVNRVMYVGAGPRAKTRITLSGPVGYTLETSEAMSAVRDLAERALGDKLRESLGGTYGVDVYLGVNDAPPSTFELTIEFEASPERIDTLANTALAELQRLSTTGPSDIEFEKTRAAKIRDLDNSSESNSYWAGELKEHALRAWPLSSVTQHQQHFKDLTIASVRAACARFLNPTQYVRVTMLPRPAATRR